MHAMRFLRLARRVIHRERRVKARPPVRSLRFVCDWGLGGWESWACCCGWSDDGGDGAAACVRDVAGGWWLDGGFACAFAVVGESGWELVPQPK